MSEPITPERVRELLGTATPGPWEAEHRGYDVYETQTDHGDVVAECGLSPAAARLIAAGPDIAQAYLDQCAETDRLRSELERVVVAAMGRVEKAEAALADRNVEIHKRVIVPLLAEAWDEGFQCAADETVMEATPDGPTDDQNPYRRTRGRP